MWQAEKCKEDRRFISLHSVNRLLGIFTKAVVCLVRALQKMPI
jgi:biotin operon repressor